MLLSLLFGLCNAGMSFLGNRVVGFSAFDLSASLVPIAVWNNEHPLFAASVMVFSYTVIDARQFRYLWITLPATILVAYLAIPINNIYILTLIYHGLGALAAYTFQYFSTKYWMFMLMNIGVNFLVARIYTLT